MTLDLVRLTFVGGPDPDEPDTLAYYLIVALARALKARGLAFVPPDGPPGAFVATPGQAFDRIDVDVGEVVRRAGAEGVEVDDYLDRATAGVRPLVCRWRTGRRGTRRPGRPRPRSSPPHRG